MKLQIKQLKLPNSWSSAILKDSTRPYHTNNPQVFWTHILENFYVIGTVFAHKPQQAAIEPDAQVAAQGLQDAFVLQHPYVHGPTH